MISTAYSGLFSIATTSSSLKMTKRFSDTIEKMGDIARLNEATLELLNATGSIATSTTEMSEVVFQAHSEALSSAPELPFTSVVDLEEFFSDQTASSRMCSLAYKLDSLAADATGEEENTGGMKEAIKKSASFFMNTIMSPELITTVTWGKPQNESKSRVPMRFKMFFITFMRYYEDYTIPHTNGVKLVEGYMALHRRPGKGK